MRPTRSTARRSRCSADAGAAQDRRAHGRQSGIDRRRASRGDHSIARRGKTSVRQEPLEKVHRIGAALQRRAAQIRKDVGQGRQHNEDSFNVSSPSGILIGRAGAAERACDGDPKRWKPCIKSGGESPFIALPGLSLGTLPFRLGAAQPDLGERGAIGRAHLGRGCALRSAGAFPRERIDLFDQRAQLAGELTE